MGPSARTTAPQVPPPAGKGFPVLASAPASRVPPHPTPLTSAAALSGGQDDRDEQQNEEQQRGQHVAQLLEEVGPALGDDDVDDAAAARQRGVCGGRAGTVSGSAQRAYPGRPQPAGPSPRNAGVPDLGPEGATAVPPAPGPGAPLWLEPLPGESRGGGRAAGSVTFRWKTRRSCRPQ